MKPNPTDAPSDPSEEISALVLQLQEAHRRLQELTGGGIDAVLSPGGESYLLHQAQEKLRKSEVSQRQLADTMLTILNALPAHIALLDARGVIIAVNEAWKKFGRANSLQDPNFLVGQNYLEICEAMQGEGEAEAHGSARGIRQVLRGEVERFSLEYPCRVPAGNEWFQLIVTPVRKDHLEGAVVMHVDITARKRNEEQLVWKTALLEAQLNSTLDGVLLVDNERRTILQNQRLLDLWHVPGELVQGAAPDARLEWVVRQVKHPAKFMEKIDWLQDHPGDTSLDEVELLDGRCFDRYSAPIHDREGRQYGRIWAFRDITERQRAEQQLRSKTALLEAQLNSTLDGILIADLEGRKILQNQRLAEIWQMPAEIVEATDQSTRVSWFASQVTDAAAFEAKTDWLYAHPHEISRDEIALVGERFIDRYTAPVRGEDGKHYGRIWVSRDITDRKRAERQAAEQLELLNMAGQVGKLGAWAAEFPGPRLIWSEEIYRIHEVEPGFKPDHDSTLSFFTPSSRRKLEAAIAARQPYDLELEIVTGKGNKRWVRTTSSVEMKDGELKRIYGIFQDITDRRRSETRFRRLIESNAQSVFFWNKGRVITDANDAFLQLVGYTREDLQAGTLNWDRMSPPEYAEADRHALAEVSARGACTVYEKEYFRKDGSRVPILIGAANFEDNPEEGICFVVDLTLQKRMESRFRRLIDSNVQGVLFWKREGDVIDANDAFLRLVGYTREELHSGLINWRELTAPEYADLDRKAMEEIADKGICGAYEKEYIRRDGTRVPVLIGAAAFEDNPNEGVRFVLDLTERKKLEQQFLRAQRMESIGTLAGGVAHDLNNILAPIMMSIGVLKLTVTDPQALDVLQTIEASSKRGAEIVRQVLSFARGIEGERIEVQPKHLVKEIQSIIRDTFPKNIRQELAVPEDGWTILGDPTQLHQVLLNLCVNARDAMPNGGILGIAVENRRLDRQYVAMNTKAKPGPYVLITVTDTGSGIPPGLLDKIFDPFFTTKEVGQGTGLGLSTVMGIVKSHEGLINVYSEVGKGTKFNVYLPALETSSGTPGNETQRLELPRGKGETILLIDDETSILTITSQTLEAFGYKVLTATDGAEGVALYAQNRGSVALVLTDMMMPLMDGTSTIRALLRLNPRLKILAASGLNATGVAAQPSESGVRHFLMKPYTAGSLLKTIRMTLEES
jgi:PAS domain S-box-containing protein